MNPSEADRLGCKAIGKTLISASGKPLGFGGVYFDENGDGQCVVIAFFYGGPNGYFVRKYLPMVMRAFRDTCQILIGMGIETVYAVADQSIPNADRFIRWIGGELLDANDPSGPVYGIPLKKMPVITRL